MPNPSSIPFVIMVPKLSSIFHSVWNKAIYKNSSIAISMKYSSIGPYHNNDPGNGNTKRYIGEGMEDAHTHNRCH